MVDMVYEKMLGRVDYLAVHLNIKSLFPDPGGSDGIIGISVFADVPLVLAQSLVIFGVHYGVFALCKLYPAKGVAVVDAAVEQYQSHERAYQAIGNRDGKIELNGHPQSVMNNHRKF